MSCARPRMRGVSHPLSSGHSEASPLPPRSRIFGGSWDLTKRRKTEPSSGARLSVFHPEFREDLRFWVETDRRIALRILDLAEAALRDSFGGIGKPEPLKFYLQ